MESDVTKILLNGMELPFFIAMWIIAIAGMIVLFLSDVGDAVKYDSRTPKKFNFWYMLKSGAIRLITGIIVISIVIVYFEDVTAVVFNSESAVGIKGFSAFLLGLAVDVVIKKVVNYGKQSRQFLKKKP